MLRQRFNLKKRPRVLLVSDYDRVGGIDTPTDRPCKPAIVEEFVNDLEKVAMNWRPSRHRSWTMSRIRSKHTKPEIVVRKAVHALGFRFRLHRTDLPGTPDLVLPGRKVVIFVNGCFWHSHANCKRARLPKSNADYWTPKLLRNKRRDADNARKLKKLGWRCVVVWECEVNDPMKLAAMLRRRIPKSLAQADRPTSSN